MAKLFFVLDSFHGTSRFLSSGRLDSFQLGADVHEIFHFRRLYLFKFASRLPQHRVHPVNLYTIIDNHSPSNLKTLACKSGRSVTVLGHPVITFNMYVKCFSLCEIYHEYFQPGIPILALPSDTPPPRSQSNQCKNKKSWSSGSLQLPP